MAGRSGASSGERCRYRLISVEVCAEPLPEPRSASGFFARVGRWQRQGRDLTGAWSLQPEASHGKVFDPFWGPEGGSDGLETFVLGLEGGNFLGVLEYVVADVCCV
ncbi:MAG TPA: hypothetical protein VKZ50_22020 [bacterium]|nr:hypothetical protein [bacterium]